MARVSLMAWCLTLMSGLSLTTLAYAQAPAAAAGDVEWTQLFNGKDLNDWVIKLNKHDVGDNYRDTFRVEDGVIKVRYDKYDEFGERFGHLNYKTPFSHYHIAVEYKITGQMIASGPSFGRLNSGIMLHSQDPKTILKDQNWPISLELQFLAMLPDNRPRPTGAVCTPGTLVTYKGQPFPGHITQPERDVAMSFPPEVWVRAEAIVRGHEKISHIINGVKVLEYSKPVMEPGVVAGADPAVFVKGKELSEGFVCLQSEGQPVDYRKVEIKVLKPDQVYEPKLEKIEVKQDPPKEAPKAP